MTRSSFAGALRRAMRSFEPSLTAFDVSLLTETITEERVDEKIQSVAASGGRHGRW